MKELLQNKVLKNPL